VQMQCVPQAPPDGRLAPRLFLLFIFLLSGIPTVEKKNDHSSEAAQIVIGLGGFRTGAPPHNGHVPDSVF